jgi:hypothetical protein
LKSIAANRGRLGGGGWCIIQAREEQVMRKLATVSITCAALLAAAALTARAEVKTVQMKIAGYLCGM